MKDKKVPVLFNLSNHGTLMDLYEMGFRNLEDLVEKSRELEREFCRKHIEARAEAFADFNYYSSHVEETWKNRKLFDLIRERARERKDDLTHALREEHEKEMQQLILSYYVGKDED